MPVDLPVMLSRHGDEKCDEQIRPGTSAADVAMDRHATGDEGAFADLYDLLAPRLLSYLCRQTRDHARAEDLVQQTMLQLHRQRGRFVRGAQVTPWAFAIARRFLIDSIRSEGRRRALEAQLVLDDRAPAPPTDDVVSSMELATKLADEFSRLPPNQRVVLELIKGDGLSPQEVAQVLGTTINAIKLRVHRAYAALHTAVHSGDIDDL